MMRIVFMGTPGLAATVLESLARHHEIVAAFTRPDAVRGRGKKLVASPVKERASALGVPVFTPKSLRCDEPLALIESLAPEAICVAAYGALLPCEILAVPRHGCFNVHTSLLPRWRGAAPIERAIMARDRETGVCIMRMEEGLDTGPYCVRKTTPVADKYLEDLVGELASLGSEALIEALDGVEDGSLSWTPQPEEGLTYASKIGKRELDFGPDGLVEDICAKVRASNDSHPSRIQVARKRVAVERAQVVTDVSAIPLEGGLAAGKAAFVAKRLLIGAADGIVELEQVKPEGKKSMEGRAFAAGIQGIKNKLVTWGSA